MSDWTITVSPPTGVQDIAAAFEEAWLDAEGAEIDAFLPLPSDPQYDRILRELIRLDLRLSWAAGKPRLLADYEDIYPAAFEDRAWLTAMALEEYRARTAAGESVTPGHYARRFNIDVSHWRAKRTFLRPTSDPDDPRRTAVLPTPPLSARRTVVKTLGAPALPKAGQTFLEFDLIRELGRGVFGRVFLARQKELAGRPVALKVTTEVDCEPQTLARLQHTNIVPIHSVARHGPLQAICMPYFGSVTLAQVIRTIGREAEMLTGTGRRFLSTLFAMRTTVCDDVRQATGLPAPEAPPHPAAPVEEPASLKALADMRPVEVALWIGARLADGLAHAHERGVLHCDLKPANILLADDGQPMLLDFNVATDRTATGKKAPRLGGTLPYMAPEHLDVIGGKAAPLSAQCDLYSPGVILYELLTGAHPFDEPVGEPASMVGVYKALHSKLPPAPSTKNKAVTPAVDGIVLKLLEPDPAKRYAEAAHLREDLERQLAHRLLRYARDPSVAERVRKWRKRNPRLSVGLAVALGAFAFLIVPATVVAVRQSQLAERRHQVARSEAILAQQKGVHTLRLAQTQMSGRAPDKATMHEGLDRARAVLDDYAVAEADWANRTPVALLPDRQRAELRIELGETLLLMARAEQWLAPDGDKVAAGAALEWNKLAERCYPADAVPRAVAQQRNRLLGITGGGADRLPEPASSPADAYHEGLDLALAGEAAKALARLIPYTDDHPDHFLAWYARGSCHEAIAQYADSAAAFTVCATLMPDFAPVYFSRGYARLKLKPADAEADFSRALDRKPNWMEARINRGIARDTLKDYAGADADLTAVLESPTAPTRIYFLRAKVRKSLGDTAGSEADIAEGRKRTPTDDRSWVTRGGSVLPINPQAALADYEEALKLNPKSRDALICKALVLGEQLKRPPDGVRLV